MSQLSKMAQQILNNIPVLFLLHSSYNILRNTRISKNTKIFPMGKSVVYTRFKPSAYYQFNTNFLSISPVKSRLQVITRKFIVYDESQLIE